MYRAIYGWERVYLTPGGRWTLCVWHPKNTQSLNLFWTSTCRDQICRLPWSWDSNIPFICWGIWSQLWLWDPCYKTLCFPKVFQDFNWRRYIFSLPFLIHSVCWKQVFSLSKIFQSLTGVCLVFDWNRSKLTIPNIPSGNWAEITKAIKLIWKKKEMFHNWVDHIKCLCFIVALQLALDSARFEFGSQKLLLHALKVM